MALDCCAVQWQREPSGATRAGAARSCCRLLACLGLFTLARVACAQGDGTPGWTSWDTSLHVSREALDSRWNTVVHLPDARADYSLGSAQPMRVWGSPGSVAGFIEIAPPHFSANDPRGFVRPQFALGGTSDSLRLLLRDAGFDAAHCLAPVMKMRSGFAGGSTPATVSLSARCSLH